MFAGFMATAWPDDVDDVIVGHAYLIPHSRTGALAYTLAFVWVFWSDTSNLTQARCLTNIALMAIIQTPARTVGMFLDTALLTVLGVLSGAAAWAIINTVSGTSYVSMAILVFVFVYLYSLLRAINPARFFGVSLIGPLLAFTAVTSSVGVSVPSTANGSSFDASFLGSTISSFLIGILISMFVNLCFWPDFAELDLKTQLGKALDTLSALLSEIFAGYLLSDADGKPLDFAEAATRRAGIVTGLRAQIAALTGTLDAADAEVFRSHMSMTDYGHALGSITTLSSHLISVEGSLSDINFDDLRLESMRDRFQLPLSASLRRVEAGCKRMLGETRNEILGVDPNKHQEEGKPATTCTRGLMDALAGFKEKQFEVLYDLFEIKHGLDGLQEDGAKVEGKLGWDTMLQVNFFVLSIQEFASDLSRLHETIHVLDPTKKRWHFHFRHYLPDFIVAVFKKPVKKAVDEEKLAEAGHLKKTLGHDGGDVTTPTASAQNLAEGASRTLKHEPRQRGWSFRKSVAMPVTQFLVSGISIYAFKCATAVLLLQMILYAQPTFFKTWNLQGTLITFLVAIAPSLGQTYLGFPIQLLASALGSIWSFAGVSAFGYGGVYGLTCFALIVAVPMVSILLHNRALSVLGLLTMLAYSNATIICFVNRSNPLFDPPSVRLYKNLANTSMGLTFSLIFTLVIYPNLARRLLRSKISSVLNHLNVHYAVTSSAAYRVGPPAPARAPRSKAEEGGGADPDMIPTDVMDELKASHRAIAIQLQALEPLMTFSAVEPRVSAPFQQQTYRKVIESMRRVLDRVGSMWTAFGGRWIDGSIQRILHGDETLQLARFEMRNTIRLLLYVYATAFVAKQRLPRELPNAVGARRRLVETFMRIVEKGRAAKEMFRREEWIRFYSFALATRGVSYEIDALAVHVKALFGELPGMPDEESGEYYGGSYGLEGRAGEGDEDDIEMVGELNSAYSALLNVRQRAEEEDMHVVVERLWEEGVDGVRGPSPIPPRRVQSKSWGGSTVT
ncbi:hypothetical protein HK101_009663 [Irineochytrium annulatum]|nr:hypothetical protein HK101_009663 [Irineochytrium annulatum]